MNEDIKSCTIRTFLWFSSQGDWRIGIQG